MARDAHGFSFIFSSIKKEGFCRLIDKKYFKELTLQLWLDVKERLLYIGKLRGEEVTFIDFMSTALFAVRSQQQTGVHNAFLFRDPSTYLDSDQEQADALWSELLKTGRDYSAQKDTSNSSNQEDTEQRFPPDMCILSALLFYPDYLKEVHGAELQLISRTSRFGFDSLNISAEHMPKVMELYVKAVKHYVKGELEENHRLYFNSHFSNLAMAFFRSSPIELDEDLVQKLFEHQLFCTVGALYALNELYDKFHLANGSCRTKEKRTEDRLFQEIDKTLQDKMPAGVPINSKAIFQKVKDYLPEGSDSLVF